MTPPFNWTCPHCNHSQTVTKPHFWHEFAHVDVAEHTLGTVGLVGQAILCANPKCTKITLDVGLYPDEKTYSVWSRVKGGRAIAGVRLIPAHSAKPQPDYIPAPIREDYIEACQIRQLSPKASATLIRRCLQGMIRDFCQISKSRLVDEIDELRDRVANNQAPPGVSPESVEAIDNVRHVGNIGAHMEKDIDVIVPVDPSEAQMLIELVEMLFDEWYVAKKKREERLQQVKSLAAAKQAAKSAPKAVAVAPGAKP